MRGQNLYELLQVSPNADQEIILAAYRRLILRYHPDRSSEPNAAEMTQRLNDAYAILSDPARRAEYDRERRGRTSSSSGGTGQTSSRTSQNRPPPPPRSPPRPPQPPRSGEGACGRRIGGFPPWFLFGGVAAVIIAVVAIVIAVSTGGNGGDGFRVQVAAPPVSTDILTPPPLPTSTPIPVPTSPIYWLASGDTHAEADHYRTAIKDYDIAISLPQTIPKPTTNGVWLTSTTVNTGRPSQITKRPYS